MALRWRGPEDHLLLVLDGRSGSYRVIERAGGVLTEIRQPDDFSRSFGFDYPMRRYEIDLTPGPLPAAEG